MGEVDYFYTDTHTNKSLSSEPPGPQARDSLHVELHLHVQAGLSKGKPVPALGRAEFDLHACHRAVASN